MLEKHKNDQFDIIIQGGQSNAEGCGLGPIGEFHVPSANVLYMNNDFTIKIAEERVNENEQKVNEFSLSFCGEYIKKGRLKDGRKLLVLRCAIGGTGWVDKRWGMNDDLYLKMMAMIKSALELNPGNKLVAFLWHQGENDCGSPYEVHYNHLKELVESVRTAYNCPNLPFIAGDFVNEWKTILFEHCKEISRAIKDVCNNIGHAGFVETEGLSSNSQAMGNADTIHFSREALRLMGIRYFGVFENI